MIKRARVGEPVVLTEEQQVKPRMRMRVEDALVISDDEEPERAMVNEDAIVVDSDNDAPEQERNCTT